MLVIISGSVDGVKKEMSTWKADTERKIKAIRKTYKKSAQLSARVQDRVFELNKSVGIYTSSIVIPVKVGSFVFNFKVYNDLLKKLKNFKVDVRINDIGHLVISYSDGRRKGCMTLNNLAKYFENFSSLPVAEIQDGP